MGWIGDFLFALAQWLKTTPLPELAIWIAKTPLSALVDTSYWVALTVQTTHILAVAGTFVSVLLINLRIVQLAGNGRTLSQTLARYSPWVWWGLLVLLATGFILIMGEPARELLNGAFWTKMVLVVVAALVAIWFQASVRKHAEAWELTPHGTIAIRIGAVAVIALWIVIMALGRWIAYAPA
jgi:hypothetical protein